MKTVIYIDLYLAFNFAVDVLCLYLCGVLCSKRMRVIRLALSALIGAVFACVSLYIRSSYFNMILSALVSLLMYWVAFYEISLFCVILGGFALFSVSALFCGIYVSVINLILFGSLKDNQTFIAYIMSAFFSVFLIRYVSSKPKTKVLTAEVHFLGKRKRVEAIVDSGNFLTEPISKMGVALLSLDACAVLLERDILIFKDGENVGNLSEDVKSRIRYVNMITANGERLTPCIRADKFVIISAKRRSEHDMYFTASNKIEGTSAECLLPNKINLYT